MVANLQSNLQYYRFPAFACSCKQDLMFICEIEILCAAICNCDHDPLAFLEQWTTSIKETPGVRMVFHL